MRVINALKKFSKKIATCRTAYRSPHLLRLLKFHCERGIGVYRGFALGFPGGHHE